MGGIPEGRADTERKTEGKCQVMLEKMAQMLATGFIWGAFLVGATGGITVTFLFLCWLGDAYEDWRKVRNRKRYEREQEARQLAYETSRTDTEATTS